jgi:hypothetical protein
MASVLMRCDKALDPRSAVLRGEELAVPFYASAGNEETLYSSYTTPEPVAPRRLPPRPRHATTCSQLAKQAWKAAGFSTIRTRRKTSWRGIPLGKSSTSRRNCSFRPAHRAIAVGPLAQASTAYRAMTITLAKECWRLTEDRGSSRSAK